MSYIVIALLGSLGVQLESFLFHVNVLLLANEQHNKQLVGLMAAGTSGVHKQ